MEQGAERVLGYSEAEALTLSGAAFFTPRDRAAGEPAKEMEAAARNGRAEDERWHVRKDGKWFWASGVLTPLREDAGQIIGFAKVMRDHTGPSECSF